MKPLVKITVLSVLGALAYGCSRDNLPLSPNAAALKADVITEDQPAYGPWGAPVNLGPVVN